MRFNLSPEWSLDVPANFQNRKENDHLIFWKAGCTLLTTIFAYSGEKHRQTLLANLKAKAEAEKLEIISEVEGQVELFGYLTQEEVIPGHERLVLHAFTTEPFSCLQTSFYIDDPNDLHDCLLTWNSVKWDEVE